MLKAEECDGRRMQVYNESLAQTKGHPRRLAPYLPPAREMDNLGRTRTADTFGGGRFGRTGPPDKFPTPSPSLETFPGGDNLPGVPVPGRLASMH